MQGADGLKGARNNGLTHPLPRALPRLLTHPATSPFTRTLTHSQTVPNPFFKIQLFLLSELFSLSIILRQAQLKPKTKGQKKFLSQISLLVSFFAALFRFGGDFRVKEMGWKLIRRVIKENEN